MMTGTTAARRCRLQRRVGNGKTLVGRVDRIDDADDCGRDGVEFGCAHSGRASCEILHVDSVDCADRVAGEQCGVAAGDVGCVPKLIGEGGYVRRVAGSGEFGLVRIAQRPQQQLVLGDRDVRSAWRRSWKRSSNERMIS